MKIEVSEPTYVIKGLSRSDLVGLAALLGKFADNPDPEVHWHTHLYGAIEDADPGIADEARRKVPTARIGPENSKLEGTLICLHCYKGYR